MKHYFSVTFIENVPSQYGQIHSASMTPVAGRVGTSGFIITREDDGMSFRLHVEDPSKRDVLVPVTNVRCWVECTPEEEARLAPPPEAPKKK